MAGHFSAKKQVVKAKALYQKYVKTSEQKELFDFSLDMDAMTTWNAWYFLTDKYLKQIQYALRRVGKVTWTQLLYHLYATSGYCKESLTWYLELQSYKFEFSNYFESYAANFGAYGLSRPESLKRFIDYHTNLAIKHKFDIS